MSLERGADHGPEGAQRCRSLVERARARPSIVPRDGARRSAVRRAGPAAPSGLEVSASTKTPGAVLRAVSTIGVEAMPKPEVRRGGDRVEAAARPGRGRRRRSACAVEPMSPRLTSSTTSAPASRAVATTRSRTAMPREPWRSKNADCGLTTATCGPTPRRRCRAKRSRPATSSVRPQASSSAACGSMPAQSGPRSSMAACEPGAEGLGAVGHRRLLTRRRGARERGGVRSGRGHDGPS